MEKVELSVPIFEKMRAGKIFKGSVREVVGIDFSNDGQLLYVADCQTLMAYTTKTGQEYRRLHLKKHEIDQVSHTHNNSAVLVATRKNYLILYWSIHENKYHRINTMPSQRSFSHDELREHDAIMGYQLQIIVYECIYLESEYRLNVQSESMSALPIANFDPKGLVFGVAWNEQQKVAQVVRICLYAIDNCESGPFTDWRRDYNEIKCMKFSYDGDWVLLATSDNNIILLNAYEGTEKYRLNTFLNESSTIECSFTPDSKYIISGSENGLIHVWDIEGNAVVKLASHVEKVSCVKFSPRNCLMVSAGRNVVWWLPDNKQ